MKLSVLLLVRHLSLITYLLNILLIKYLAKIMTLKFTRHLSLLLLGVLTAFVLTACAASDKDNDDDDEEKTEAFDPKAAEKIIEKYDEKGSLSKSDYKKCVGWAEAHYEAITKAQTKFVEDCSSMQEYIDGSAEMRERIVSEWEGMDVILGILRQATEEDMGKETYARWEKLLERAADFEEEISEKINSRFGASDEIEEMEVEQMAMPAPEVDMPVANERPEPGVKPAAPETPAAPAPVKAAPAPAPEKPKPDMIFDAVEQQAQFPGGMAALSNWLSRNIRYPEAAQRNEIQGKVIVQFVVEKDGSVSNPTVLRGVDRDLDQEALRVVRAMPKWQPGRNNGTAVRSKFTLPIAFRLTN